MSKTKNITKITFDEEHEEQHLFYAIFRNDKKIKVVSRCGFGEFVNPCKVCLACPDFGEKFTEKRTIAFLKETYSFPANSNARLIDDIFSKLSNFSNFKDQLKTLKTKEKELSEEIKQLKSKGILDILKDKFLHKV